jgi:uncharacterized protein (DUF1501 family)
LFEQGFVGVMGRCIEVQRILTQALEGSTVNTVFPNSGLGTQMRMVARLIAARRKLRLKKQCFFCSIGGFDTHGDDQLTRQSELLAEVNGAISAFYAATQELNVGNNVTTFTEAYAATLGRWFGANKEVLGQVFPRLGNFERYVGFMG